MDLGVGSSASSTKCKWTSLSTLGYQYLELGLACDVEGMGKPPH